MLSETKTSSHHSFLIRVASLKKELEIPFNDRSLKQYCKKCKTLEYFYFLQKASELVDRIIEKGLDSNIQENLCKIADIYISNPEGEYPHSQICCEDSKRTSFSDQLKTGNKDVVIDILNGLIAENSRLLRNNLLTNLECFLDIHKNFNSKTDNIIPIELFDSSISPLHSSLTLFRKAKEDICEVFDKGSAPKLSSL